MAEDNVPPNWSFHPYPQISRQPHEYGRVYPSCLWCLKQVTDGGTLALHGECMLLMPDALFDQVATAFSNWVDSPGEESRETLARAMSAVCLASPRNNKKEVP